ncbi:hypothetical protein [Megamonas funiformis]|uniref:hypothetical protein n=1 Tax=Megamonas funiformis TaxID=437897 RepID=UPI0024302D6D|nr:hypothetical protein [Megamonas funiformis]
MINKCIYCGNTNDLSESDIIPDALTNARILNKNVCRIEHNNKFSDMFESEVIKALSFITNKLDIKSSKGKRYASYKATLKIDDTDYNTSLHEDNNIFNGRVLKSLDKTKIMSSYEKTVEIAGDESKVCPVDINNLEIEKKVPINTEIFYSKSMYRLISKIAFEWYCAKNNVVGYHQEFDNIILFITTGNGNNPVGIIQQADLYTMLTNELQLGSHTLFGFETLNGEINVVVFLFGLLMYRVEISKLKPKFCNANFLFTELCVDSSRKEIKHDSIEVAEKCFNNIEMQDITLYPLYPTIFNMIKVCNNIHDDVKIPNKNINNIFIKQLENIVQSVTVHKKSIKRFVNEVFSEGHSLIRLNFNAHNKKAIIFFYIVYLVGLNNIDKLNDDMFQHIIREKLPYQKIITDEIEQQLKNQIMENNNYPNILERGANIIKQWDK